MKKIIVLLTSLVLLSSCNHSQGIDGQEINQNCKANAISNEQLADLLYSKGVKGVQFVDIRTPHKFAMGHIPGAINVPMKNFFNDAYFSKISNKDAVILYGDDASSPRLMALLSGHYNKGFFQVALGGYDYIQNKILNNYGIYSGLYDDEVPLVDYQKAVNEIRSRSGGSAAPAKAKKASSKPIVKRKKKEVSGGCG